MDREIEILLKKLCSKFLEILEDRIDYNNFDPELSVKIDRVIYAKES